MTNNYSIHPFFSHTGPVATVIERLSEFFRKIESPEPRIKTKIKRAFLITPDSRNFAQLLLQMDPHNHMYLDDTHLDRASSFPCVFGNDIKILMEQSADGHAMIPKNIVLPDGAEGAVILFQASCCDACAINAAVVRRTGDGTFTIHTVPSMTGRAISFIDGRPAWEVFSHVPVVTSPKISQDQDPSMYF